MLNRLVRFALRSLAQSFGVGVGQPIPSVRHQNDRNGVGAGVGVGGGAGGCGLSSIEDGVSITTTLLAEAAKRSVREAVGGAGVGGGRLVSTGSGVSIIATIGVTGSATLPTAFDGVATTISAPASTAVRA